MTAEVKPLFGGFTHQPEVVETVVEILEQMLELARSGQMNGLAMASVDYRGLCNYAIAGRVGGYALLGAMEMVKAELISNNWEQSE